MINFNNGNMEEIWYQVPNYEFYEYSNLLRFRSKSRRVMSISGQEYTLPSQIMKITLPKNGYAYITLKENGKKKTLKVHRFFALQFIPNPENKEQVNHKNGIKHDYSLENLEWVTRQENSIHAFKHELIKIKKGNETSMYGKRGKETGMYGKTPHNAKIVLDMQTGIYYETAKAASIAKGLNHVKMCEALRGVIPNKTGLYYV